MPMAAQEIRLTALEGCSDESVAYVSFPLVLILCTLVFLGHQHRCSRSKSNSIPLIKRKSSIINLCAQITLVTVKTAISVYLLLSSLDGCKPLSQINRLLTSLGALIILVNIPPIEDYRAVHHLSCLIVVYFGVFLEALYQVYILSTSVVEQYAAYIHLGVSILLFILAALIPYPLNPNNVDTPGTKIVEVKSNQVYRDGRPLIPEAMASALSWASFQWMDSFIINGYKRVPSASDIYAMSSEILPRAIYSEYLDVARLPSCFKLWKRLYMANRKHLWLTIVSTFLENGLEYLSIYFRQQFIRYIENTDGRPIKVAYGFVLGVFLVRMSISCIHTIGGYSSQILEFRTVTMLNIAIFNKTLRRKDMSGRCEKEEDDMDTDEAYTSTSNNGKIVNLMSHDAWTIATYMTSVSSDAFSPVNICLTLLYLYNLLGVAALVGCTSMLLMFPVNWLFAGKIAKMREERCEAEDARVDLVNEMLDGIRLIKYFAWEANWKEKILKARKLELQVHLRAYFYTIIVVSISNAIPLLVSIISFVWYTKVDGNELTASVAFICISLFRMLDEPLLQIPNAIACFAGFKVSLERISGFFDEPEANQDKRSDDNLTRVGFEESEFKWYRDVTFPEEESSMSSNHRTGDQQFRLFVPAFDFPVGCLTIVCGSTGSGKSSFLSALLGEMDTVSGRVYLPSKCQINPPVSRIDPNYPDLFLDKVAYVCQRPFLQQDTIRNNILFGEPFDPIRYKKVISQCALAADLSLWPARDLTEIGQKGITLSGGQQQRVSLARAIYSYAKTVLLDDCLSAVDSHTARHIYEKCINGELLKGRTVILTTHYVRLCLPSAKCLVKITDGHVVWQKISNREQHIDELESLVGGIAQVEPEQAKDTMEEDFEIGTDKDIAQKLITDEEAAQGSVDLKLLLFYLRACGTWFFWLILIGFSFGVHLSYFSESWWLRKWALAYSTMAINMATNFSTTVASGASALFALLPSYENIKLPIRYAYSVVNQDTVGQESAQQWSLADESNQGKVDVNYYILVYALIGAVQVLVYALESISATCGSLNGSMTLFKDLLEKVTGAPMRFFDTTPVGRILNRFGGDMSVIDYCLITDMSYFTQTFTGMILAMLIVSVITPVFVVAIFVISIVNFMIGCLYVTTSRELKRINSIHMSPIYALFTESLDGVTTIRAYMQQTRFMSTIYKMQDDYMAPAYLMYATNRWFSVRLDITGAILTLTSSIFVLWNIDQFDAGLVGISLMYAGEMNRRISSLINYYADLQIGLTSVQRIQEYIEVEQEPPSIIEGCRPPAAWPTTAAIQVRDLEIRYTPESDPVLHSISFEVKPHEKIGIVGRTGSGKSTLALSFFRFVEAARGSITIDGINIFDIGLQDLRSRITIIPQDAKLFSGTIRSNLDPFDKHTDNELWESLQRVHLSHSQSDATYTITEEEVASLITRYPITSLDQVVSDGGNNYSQGERQLICMARALLRNSRLVIMDEATASVDFDMDAQVQKTIRQEFADATLICIAHRLRTVIDYDRILVLSQGNIVEYDTPHNLLSQPTGVFRSMCEKSGELDVLADMAKQSSLQRMDDPIMADDHSTFR